MALPVQQVGNSGEPLAIDSIRVDYPDDFIEGDVVYTEIWFNRDLEPYEERAAKEHLRQLRGFALERSRLRTRLTSGQIDAAAIREFVRLVSYGADELQRQGNLDREQLRVQGEHLLSKINDQH